MSARGRLEAWCNARWYGETRPPRWLAPAAALYGAIADGRARRHAAAAAELPLPVVVVGNITAGGAGKTPLTIALAALAHDAGLRVGIVSRGYGAGDATPRMVTDASTADAVGDEPLLIARRTGAPVCVARDRSAAVRHLAGQATLDLVLADDGLQHYRMRRQAEICAVDGARGLGNGARLPAGPLREPPERLARCDLVVINGEGGRGDALARAANAVRVRAVMREAVALRDGARQPLAALAGRPVHAIAGIAHPQRFFAALEAAGLQVTGHALADHQAASPALLATLGDAPLLMTEKDAVKLPTAAAAERAWYSVPITLEWCGDGAERARALLLHAARCGADRS